MTLAIGGWNEGSEKYSEMAADPVSRQTFARSALSFIRRHKFDGLDLDWEYPGKRGGKPEDRENFILLIKDLHKVDISLTIIRYYSLKCISGVLSSRTHAHSSYWSCPWDY